MNDIDKMVANEHDSWLRKPLQVTHVDMAREFMNHTVLRYMNDTIEYGCCVVDVYINDIYVCEFSDFYEEVCKKYFDDRFSRDKVIYKGVAIRNEYTVKQDFKTKLYLRSVG